MSPSTDQKVPPGASWVFLLLFISSAKISSCFHWDGNILYDLETNTQSDFTIETADWTLSSSKIPGVKFYNCANSFIMGGYGVLGGTALSYPAPTMQYFQRTYSSLPIHNQIYLQMKFYQLDTWDTVQDGYSDYFSIGIDGNSITGWALDQNYAGRYPLCGEPTIADFVFTLSLAYPHSASSLTLRMISSTNEDSTNESFGFRDIKIEFLTISSPYSSLCAPGVPSSYLSASRCQTSCTTSGNSIIPASYGFCLPPSCSTNCKRCSDTPAACISCPSGSFLIGTTCYPTCDYPLSTNLLGGVAYCETPCPGQYAWWDGSCSSLCSYSTTYGSYAIAGTTVNMFQVCTYPCATNQFLYWNTSCLSACPGPLITTTYRNQKFCEFPCASLEYLYWNGSCLNTCPDPLRSETQSSFQPRKFCWYPCQPSEYLYWNGSCINNCPSPLSPEIQGITHQRNFCWYTCQQSEYLYWNQSCLNDCPVPLLGFKLSNNTFCFLPCSMPNIYWYQDLSCRPECNFPYNHIYRDSVEQCLEPCSRPSEYFYGLEKECHNTCDPPYTREIINTIKVCHIDASTLASETNKIKSAVQVIGTLGKVTSTILKVTSIPQFSTPKSPLLIQLSALMHYIRYMKINYPWRVQLLFQSNDTSLITLNIDFSIPQKVQDKLDNYPLPDVFEKYSLDSNFINNMWDLINTVLLIILVICALLFFKPIFKENPKTNLVITRMIQCLKWNIPIAMIAGSAGEIIFYASLQTRNTPLGSPISIVSLTISLIMIFLIFIILMICLEILRSFHPHKQKIVPTLSSESQDWRHKWKGCEILYEEIEEKSLFSLAYMAIHITRTILFFAIIANLYDYPLTQSILINFINLSVFIYLLYYRPLKDIWNKVQLFSNEILGNILTVCVLTLAIMDKAEIEARYSRVTIGNVMIIIMLIFYILGVAFLAIEGILFLIKAYKTWKEMRAQGIRNPFKMIKILLLRETRPAPEETIGELSQTAVPLNLSTAMTAEHPAASAVQRRARRTRPRDISTKLNLPPTQPNKGSLLKPLPQQLVSSGPERRQRKTSFANNLPEENSTRSYLSTIQQFEGSRLEPPNQHPVGSGAERKARKTSLANNLPGYISSRSFLPSTYFTDLDVSRAKSKGELEGETLQANPPRTITIESRIEFESPPEERNVGENIQEIALSESFEPSLQPNRRNLKPRIKGPNQFRHK